MSTAPCKDCERKGCGAYHSQCKEYLEFQRENEKRYKERKKEAEIIEYRRNCI